MYSPSNDCSIFHLFIQVKNLSFTLSKLAQITELIGQFIPKSLIIQVHHLSIISSFVCICV
ncbi:MAG: hypothetical protein P1U46_04350 [Patescibacteria group bacterium]|nr:hypothetical protein [Patescibacteria group bacterium]